NHTWAFFDTDVPGRERWVLDGIDTLHWDRHEVRFPTRRRTIDVGYNSIRSEALDRAVRKALRPDQHRLGQPVQTLSPTSVSLEGGESLEADCVIDARGAGAMPGIELGWQKFVGVTCRFAEPHGVTAPVIMDGTVDQIDGYRFVYQLPVSATELLIEDTYYSASPVLDEDSLRGRIGQFAGQIGARPEAVNEERGVLPVVMDGESASLWAGEPAVRLGIRGGFFHPTTSYSLPDAVANAALLVEQHDLSANALHRLFRRRAEQLWDQRSFFRLLNRMLFRAAEPDQAYRVLEHFYRLPPPLISRFYAARLNALDKVRVLSGRPPVSIGRALTAMRSRAA
ncbi:MAG: lycopene beta-cyclase CrtY, partial [Sphingomicrobium sp.]